MTLKPIAILKALASLMVFFTLSSGLSAQAFWQEDFGWGCNRGTLANGFVSANGTWTVSNTGNNGAQAHQWFVSSASSFDTLVALPQCDMSCAVVPAMDNQTLHISTPALTINIPPAPAVTLPADSLGIVLTGGLCAGGAGVCIETNKRVESPPINCSGWTNINIRLNYFEGGTAPNQECFLAYFDGTNWNNTFFNLTKSTGPCPNAQWRDILIPLPASSQNNPNVKVGFVWSNTDPAAPSANLILSSFGADNIELFGNPFVVTVNASFNVNGPTTVCIGDQVRFNNLSTSADSFVWNFPGGTPNLSNLQNPIITYNSQGVYPVSLLAYNKATGNFDDTTVFNFIRVDSCNAVPIANFSPQDTTICAGDSIQFRDLSSGNPDRWAWFFPNASNFTFDSTQNPPPVVYNNAGVYEVTLIAFNTAGFHDTTVAFAVKVNECFKPIPDFRVADDSICANTCVQIIDESQYGEDYFWLFPGADSTTDTSFAVNPTVCYTRPGLYEITLVLTNTNGTVVKTETAAISVDTIPNVDAGPDIELLAGDFTLIRASGDGFRFFWLEFGENPNNLNEENFTLSCRTCDAPTANPKDSTTYVVYNINRHGCFATDTVSVIITDEYYIGVPSAFSPNLDGENDELYVLGNGFFEINFTVFNRFGQVVFQTSDPTQGWDGRYNDIPMDPGVYAYSVQVVFLNGVEEVISGNVTLVK